MLMRSAFVVVMMPVFAVVGGLVAYPFAYGWESEDPADPSPGVTVMAVWESGAQPLCRAFDLRLLLAQRDTLPLRFALNAADIERCRADFASYDSRTGWPRSLGEGDLPYPDYWFEVEDQPPNPRLLVHRSSGDATWTKTRYRVEEEGVISDLELRTASSGQGVWVVMGSLAGILVWVGWVFRLGWRAWRRRLTTAALAASAWTVGSSRVGSTLAFGFAVLVAACAGGETTGPGPDRSSVKKDIEVLSGESLADTVGARIMEPIVARVLDGDGLPVPGWKVDVRPTSGTAGVWIRETADGEDTGELVLTTDDQARFEVYVTLRTETGQAMVDMRAQGFLTSTTQVPVDILPGAPTVLELDPPVDVATVHDSVPFPGRLIDQHGNTVSEDLSLSASGPAEIVGGMVVGTDPGTVTVVGTSGTLTDTVSLTVVPEGRIVFPDDVATIRSMHIDGIDSASVSVQYVEAVPDVAADPTGTGAVFSVGGAIYVTDMATYQEVAVGSPLSGASSPRFAPDRALIYFQAELPYRGDEIWRISPNDGSTAERVTEVPIVGDADRFPAPSNGGDRLVFARTTGGSIAGPLVLLDLEGGGETPLGVDGQSSRWSPDDAWIAYLDPDAGIRRIRPDGTEDQAVTSGEQFHENFAWSPDGRFLIASNQARQLRLVEVETGEVLTIPHPYAVHGVDAYPGS